jgi:AmiR/NasT family two-component response regulator
VNAQIAEPSLQELHAESRLARLQAQLASMPVIEQAKGVLMARQGCDADQAFELLRRASQRSSVPVRDLAEQIVKNAERRRGPR